MRAVKDGLATPLARRCEGEEKAARNPRRVACRAYETALDASPIADGAMVKTAANRQQELL
jgi:hypothetical protein